MDDASRAQVEAADPARSTWLSANAGSGKTRVLTDRVARLLLDGVPPERILCLTYTKAAASEMQNRLFGRLGEWAMLADAALRVELGKLGVEASQVTDDLLSRSRTLFARAIETPGGLKIQTIHSFCASLLRRFPLEGGVSPGFRELDDRARRELMADVLDELAEGEHQPVIDAVARHLSGSDGDDLVKALLGHQDTVGTFMNYDEIAAWLGLPKGTDEASLIASVRLGDEEAICAKMLSGMKESNPSHKRAVGLLPGFPWATMGLEELANLEAAVLSGPTTKTPNAPRTGIVNSKDVSAAMGDDHAALEALLQRVADARPLRQSLQIARKTNDLHRFAEVFLPAYAEAKQIRGVLDFDDLILRTRALLTERAVAQWVLFRLDGGLDHILVDEAQDTSPAQWQIIAAIAEEFAAGESARSDLARTIFVVGDKKQSIFSFQGADPAEFDRMRAYFETRLAEIGETLQSRELKHSFRSAAPILSLVDQVAQACTGVGEAVEHVAFHGDLPGRIDLWPLIEPSEKQKPSDWMRPLDLVADDHHDVILAGRVAEAIDTMLHDGTSIVVRGVRRPVQPRDILILVRKRSDLFFEIIAAIKARGLPIAGADRMPLTAQLAVRDLIALLAFVATPEDDLSLAAVLRSPIFGWSEAELFDLAHDRTGFLWATLRARQDEFPDTFAILTDLRDRADFMRPYDLLERALIRHDARRRLLARLGAEAEDGIDAMLSQALIYEQQNVPSLTGFVGWLQTDEVEIKRDPNGAGDQIRVMSVHGAKGLEAPIVILPDTVGGQDRSDSVNLLEPEPGVLLWSGASGDSPPILDAAIQGRKDRASEERDRLLYVAMTRAESWLIVAGAGKLPDKGKEARWYYKIDEAMTKLGAAPLDVFGETGKRIEAGDWSGGAPALRDAATTAPALPDWAQTPAPPAPRDRAVLSPSALGGAKVMAGDGAGLDENAAKRRGLLIHLLLEHLPRLPAPSWPDAAPEILALGGGADEAEVSDLLAEASAVLTAPALAPLFRDDGLAEVELTAFSPVLDRQLLGIIDRLEITDDRVLAVDFKSNALVPEDPADVPEGILRQMGAYAEMLGAIYPGRTIATAILWTRRAQLMELPHADVMSALQRARAS